MLFMSGYPGDLIYQKDLLEKDAELILKPISPSALLKKVTQAVL